MVLLYFLRVRCHEYAAAVMVLSWKYSSTYHLTLTHLSYAANLSSATIWCAPMHMVLKTHIIEISELKLHIWHSLGKVTARNLAVWLTQEPKTD